MRVSKTRIMRMALAFSGKEALKGFVGKSCAVIFTDINPFELFSFLKKNKGSVAAKAGQIAPEDILIQARDTGLPPGPALSDLKASGLDVRVLGQTIVIAKDKVVTKKGEPVSKAVAGTLSKLDIKPIKIGMRVLSVFENGQLFDENVLDIDTQKVFQEFVAAYNLALNLAFNSRYFSKETIPLLVVKAFREAKAVALEFEIFDSGTISEFIERAAVHANALKSKIPFEETKKAENGGESG
ncbi:MAG: 50S ribosomal protein L10 [Candidatus Diapherotrites archaeon]|nr:50S ribosomal protein L10 [Candidatus Diapherotrites archaeon]